MGLLSNSQRDLPTPTKSEYPPPGDKNTIKIDWIESIKIYKANITFISEVKFLPKTVNLWFQTILSSCYMPAGKNSCQIKSE